MTDLEKMLADYATKGGTVTKIETGRSKLVEDKIARQQRAGARACAAQRREDLDAYEALVRDNMRGEF